MAKELTIEFIKLRSTADALLEHYVQNVAPLLNKEPSVVKAEVLEIRKRIVDEASQSLPPE